MSLKLKLGNTPKCQFHDTLLLNVNVKRNLIKLIARGCYFLLTRKRWPIQPSQLHSYQKYFLVNVAVWPQVADSIMYINIDDNEPSNSTCSIMTSKYSLGSVLLRVLCSRTVPASVLQICLFIDWRFA